MAPAHLMNWAPETYSSHWRQASWSKSPALDGSTNFLRQCVAHETLSERMLSAQHSKHVGAVARAAAGHAAPSSLRSMPALTRHARRSPSVCDVANGLT